MNEKLDLSAIRLWNYHGFRDTGWIRFNNLVMLFGYNSNGKSTILKYLNFILGCVQDYQSGIEMLPLTVNNMDEGTWQDIVFQGKDKETDGVSFGFRFELSQAQIHEMASTFSDPCIGIRVSPYLQYILTYKVRDKSREVYIADISIGFINNEVYGYHCEDNGDFYIRTTTGYSWDSEYPLPQMFTTRNTIILKSLPSYEYKKDISMERISGEVAPHMRFITQTLNTLQGMINSGILSFADELDYLQPYRKVPERTMTLAYGDVVRSGSMGENTYNVLFKIEEEDDDKKKDFINKWLELFGYHYEWRIVSKNRGEFLLVNLESGYKVNIRDVGFGISQILPIIVECARNTDGMLAVDTPDAHLHEKAQSEIMDMLLSVTPKRKVLLETHSDNMLLRLQRRIAEGVFSPENATIYFVSDENNEAKCYPITFNERGDFEDPSGQFELFFNTAYEDAMETVKAIGRRMSRNEKGD